MSQSQSSNLLASARTTNRCNCRTDIETGHIEKLRAKKGREGEVGGEGREGRGRRRGTKRKLII